MNNSGLKKTPDEVMFRATQGANENHAMNREMLHRVVEVLDSLANRTRAASESQDRQQRAMIWLTVALVIATIVYTIVTFMSVCEAHRGNGIQAVIADMANRPLKNSPAAGRAAATM